jgi:hypothetical protein
MDAWYELMLGDGWTSLESVDHIQSEWQRRYRTGLRGLDEAVFCHTSVEDGMITAYFPPACAALARSMWATPCLKPPRKGIEILCGDSGALSRHFWA